MRKTFQYRIYPTKAQANLMSAMLEECRWVYNETLAYRKDLWESHKKSISLYKTNKLLPQWKCKRPTLTIVYSQVLQDVQERVDLAFKAFFRRVKAGEKPGYPRFRGEGRYDSFTYSQFGFSIKDSRLEVAKIGLIKIKLHRIIEGRIKTLTLRRYTTGKWFACFSVEAEGQMLPQLNKAVGIDVGLRSFATLSTGEKIANPHFFRQDEKALAKAQRRMTKFEKGTPEREKARKIVSHIHEHIVNRRNNFAHQISHRLINEYGVIAFEKLDINNMLGNHCLNKSIADASWHQLVFYTTYKAECAGRKVVLVDAHNTSKRCSRCGSLVDKSPSAHIHSCPICDLILDRDLNASINILALGLQGMGSIPKSPRL